MFKVEYWKGKKLVRKTFNLLSKAIRYITKRNIQEYFLDGIYCLEV